MNFLQFERAKPDSIPIGAVRSLLVDASDNLWILLQNTLVFRYHNGVFEPIRGQTENGTTAMARGTSGAILLSSLAEGTITYKDNQFRSLSSAVLLTDAARAANGEAPDQPATPFSWFDRLAVPTSVVIANGADRRRAKFGLARSVVGCFTSRTASILSASNDRVATKMNCILPVQNSAVLVGTAKGMMRWNGTHLTAEGVPSSLLNLDVLSLLGDRDSNIWVGTNRGLFRYNANGISLASVSEPINALFEDREGNIWFGTTRGLERLRDTAFVTYTFPNLESQSMGATARRLRRTRMDRSYSGWIAMAEGRTNRRGHYRRARQ